MTQDQKRIEEWKERNVSYRQYCAFYLTIHTLCLTVWVFGMASALQGNTARLGSIALYAITTMIMVLLFVVHILGEKGASYFRIRIKKLENELGFESFDTTWPLMTGIKIAQAGTAILLVITVFFLISSILGID